MVTSSGIFIAVGIFFTFLVSNAFGSKFSIRIASHEWDTEQTFVEHGCTSFDCYKGVYPGMLSLLQSKLNFTFKIEFLHQYPYELENGSWTGKIGKLFK